MLVLSQRSYQHWPSYDLVYEWEDEMVKALPASKIFHIKQAKILRRNLIDTVFYRTGINLHRLALMNRNSFMFAMSPEIGKNIWNLPNLSVNIIDFYPTKELLPAFYGSYDKVKNLYVSCREVYDFLKANNPLREIRHLPLTLPDKYRIDKDTTFDKKYDLVMVGRQSPTMTDYLRQYEQKHPILYVYRGKIKDNNFSYYTNKGEFAGYVNTREDYFKLLRNGKIVLYSTPGIDDGKETHGFHQVTPRFLEALACGCIVISQYEDNSDTDFYELSKISLRVKSYNDFEKAMDEALNTEVNMDKYSHYLEKHYTSTYKDLMSDMA